MCSDIFCIFALENKLYVMINKEKILEEAIKNCMREMYKKAQPSEDWDHIVYKYQSGELGKNEIVYDRYYYRKLTIYRSGVRSHVDIDHNIYNIQTAKFH